MDWHISTRMANARFGTYKWETENMLFCHDHNNGDALLACDSTTNRNIGFLIGERMFANYFPQDTAVLLIVKLLAVVGFSI